MKKLKLSELKNLKKIENVQMNEVKGGCGLTHSDVFQPFWISST